MENLRNFLTDADFNRIAFQMEGNDFDGIVWIEDDSDKVFWESFLSEISNRKYQFNTASKCKKGVTGKIALTKLYATANIDALVAVDSDYDYIRSLFEDDHVLNCNKFILHTFAYSRENAQIEAKSTNDFFIKTKFSVAHNVNIEAFITNLSEAIFTCLATLVCCINSSRKCCISSLNKCTDIPNIIAITNDMEINKELLTSINNSISEFTARYSFSQEELLNCKKLLNSYGITDENAYRFSHGHRLENIIIHLHTDLINQLKRQEARTLPKKFSGAVIEERKNQVYKELDENHNIKTHFKHYPICNNDEIHKKILSRISDALS